MEHLTSINTYLNCVSSHSIAQLYYHIELEIIASNVILMSLLVTLKKSCGVDYFCLSKT